MYGMSIVAKYDRAAQSWDHKLLRYGYNAAYTDFFEDCALGPGPVLDIGAGTGAFTLSWIAAGGNTDLTLVDPSQAMLKRANLRFLKLGLYPNLINCSYADFPEARKFRSILASHVLEHFQDPQAAMCKISRNLLKGGFLYLVVSKPHWCNWLIWLRYQHRWHRADTVLNLAHQAGLQHTRLHEFRSGPPSRTSLGYVFYKP
jgi:demethylmenaquinone methyltransferase/2-methoxy-6-polyprenyl-1,4-benzoquinol methylase